MYRRETDRLKDPISFVLFQLPIAIRHCVDGVLMAYLSFYFSTGSCWSKFWTCFKILRLWLSRKTPQMVGSLTSFMDMLVYSLRSNETKKTRL